MKSFETLEGRQFCSASAYAFDIPMQSTDSEIAVEMETSVRTTKLVTTRTQNFEIPSENLESTPVRVIESSVRTTKFGTTRTLAFEIPVETVASESTLELESSLKATKFSTTPVTLSVDLGTPAALTTPAANPTSLNRTSLNTSTATTQLISNVIGNAARTSRTVSLSNLTANSRR